MNILYLTHRVPFPPNKGDKIRSFRELEGLARRHRVWCACFVDTPADNRFADLLRAYCHDVSAVRLDRRRATLRGIAGLIRGKTITESFYRHAAMREVLRTWGKSVRFDVVVAFSSGMADYALQVPADRHVLDMCDLDSRKWMDYAAASRAPARWLYQTEGHRLAEAERAWIDRFDATILVSEAEASDLRGVVEPSKLHIVGNGVSLPDLAETDGVVHTDGKETILPDSRPVVGFVGVMDYRPNVDAVSWFVSHCWREIRAAIPEAVFRIVGRSPARRVRRLASTPGVEVVGEVEDTIAEVRRFDVSVAPVRLGRGVQNKVLEAMAAAKPVVLTRKAAEGISGRHLEDFVVADQPAEITEAVVRLLCDPAERRRLGRAARRFVAVHHCWEEMLRKFELVVTGMIPQTARRVPLLRKPVALPTVAAALP